jgi:hypothetical protein
MAAVADYTEGISPHPVLLPRKIAMAILPLQSVHIRKRIWTGEGTPEFSLRLVQASPLPWGEGQGEGSNARSLRQQALTRSQVLT